jgi:arylsulfatase A-like enzyme
LFGEHGARRHHHGVYAGLTHLPLVVSGDDLTGTSEEVTSILDVAETIAKITGLDMDCRGHDLREDIPPRTCLSEYHGFRESRKEHYRKQGFSDEEIFKYDQPLRGIAAPSSYYGYQTVEDYREQGTASIADPRAELEDSITELNAIDSTGESDLNVEENVKNTLSDLGYI